MKSWTDNTTGFNSNLIASKDRIIGAIIIFMVFFFYGIFDKIKYYGGFEYIPIDGFIFAFINSIVIFVISMVYLVINWKKDKNQTILIGLGILALIIGLFLPFGHGFVFPNKINIDAFSIPLVFLLLLVEIIFGLLSCIALTKSHYKEDFDKAGLIAVIAFLSGIVSLFLIYINLLALSESSYELGFYILILGTITIFIGLNSINSENSPSKNSVQST